MVRPRALFAVVSVPVAQGFFDVPPFCFPDNVEKSVGMNIKLRLAEEEEMEGPTLELVFTEGEMLLKEKELRGDEQQRFCTESTGKD